MRTESMRSRMIYNRPLPVSRIVGLLADKAQVNTQNYGRRPYGVGLLVIGHDETGPHLFDCNPTGNNFEYYAMSIGSRSQSAKTYLESHFDSFPDCSLDELIKHGLTALRDTLQQENQLSIENCSIGYVGKDTPFTILDGEAVSPYLDQLEFLGRSNDRDQAATGGDDTAMDTDP